MKLVRYNGVADSRVIKASEFAAAGLNGIGDMQFSKGSTTDYYRSVSDLVAIFLLSQGDFVAEDGSSIFDIFQNAVTEATAEVLSVNEQTGEVVIPGYGTDAPNGTAALRKLGRAAGKALAGNDPIITDAIVKANFSEDDSVIIYKDTEGNITPLVVPAGCVVGRKATGEIVAIPFEELQGEIDEAGPISLDQLSDVEAPNLGGGYVLGTIDGENWEPVLVGDVTAVPFFRRGFKNITVASLPATVDLTTDANKGFASYTILVSGSDDGALSLKLPDPTTSSQFELIVLFGTVPRSGNFQLTGASGTDLLMNDPYRDSTFGFAIEAIIRPSLIPFLNDGEPLWSGLTFPASQAGVFSPAMEATVSGPWPAVVNVQQATNSGFKINLPDTGSAPVTAKMVMPPSFPHQLMPIDFHLAGGAVSDITFDYEADVPETTNIVATIIDPFGVLDSDATDFTIWYVPAGSGSYGDYPGEWTGFVMPHTFDLPESTDALINPDTAKDVQDFGGAGTIDLSIPYNYFVVDVANGDGGAAPTIAFENPGAGKIARFVLKMALTTTTTPDASGATYIEGDTIEATGKYEIVVTGAGTADTGDPASVYVADIS